MKKLKLLTMLLLVLFASNLVKAQVYGYGNAVPPSVPLPDPLLGSGSAPLFTDDNRAEIINTPIYTSFITLSIDINNLYGSFNMGDEVLMIQMKGANIGLHQNAKIVGISGTTLQLKAIVSAGFLIGYSTRTMNPTDRLQLIKINNYTDFTINRGGIVACHPWNDIDGSGSILCIDVAGTLTINGGYFTASAAGYTAKESPGIIFRGSNTGEPGGTLVSIDPSAGPTTSACAGSAGSVPLTGSATNGSYATGQISKGSTNSGVGINYGIPNENISFIIGTPGYYKTTATPVYGSGYYDAGGGGKGGDGALTSCLPLPTTGANGNASGSGGAAGVGGNAGGGIYIKAFYIVLNTTNTVFVASGSDAQYGEDGADGGIGGRGGAGGGLCPGISGPTCVSTTTWPGQYGGWGDNGIGGDGGDGGHPGTIWVKTPNPITSTLVPPAVPPITNFANSNFNVNGGLGGYGGYQGYGGGNFTPNSINITNPCDATTCSTINYTPCNVDVIMCVLEYCYTSLPPTGSVVRFSTSLPTTYVEYDNSAATLSLYVSSVLVQSVGVLNPLTAWSVFQEFNATMNISSGFLGYVTDNRNCGTTNPVSVYWAYPGILSLPYATYTYSGRTPYFEILFGTMSGSKVYFDRCPQSYGPGSNNGGPGGSGWSGGTYSGQPRNRARKGDDAPNGIIDVTGTNHHANAFVDVPPSPYWKTSGVDEATQSISKLSIYPNPTSGDIWLNLNSISAQLADITVIDATGKEVYKQTFKLQKNDNAQLLKTDGIAKGVYTLQVQTTDGKLTQQLIIK